ncbi:type II toxin-antitoxin system Phd/YefM family antitoxin [Zobellia uliginosa]|uniref:type II toxin-antitoxin system Phd/YefM family antitoxin n=1 Tax=Zobellia uliginosa TaxID=143224 RepID=UPI001C067567|nr:type II toxin-antitoxin system Phd/YefM family antitoxin [Zobellia uliginosa]MBU2946606.1 type II toxin-antitoxin system Phd/YefM family antitoxin [Zobellia uliginosa]
METTNYTELRKQLKHKLDIVSEDKETVLIHRSGQEDVVMISLSEYNSWMETEYLLSTDANKESLTRSLSEAENGKVVKKTTKNLWK